MSEISIHNVVICADQESLSFRDAESEAPLVSFEGPAVGVLMDFLKLCCRNELNRRASFRVPTSESCGLSVAVRFEKEAIAAQPRNLSLGGILVELSTMKIPPPGTAAEVELSFEDSTLAIPGVVCRQDGRMCAFEFTSMPPQESATPLRDLARIVMEIQRRRLSSRSTVQVG